MRILSFKLVALTAIITLSITCVYSPLIEWYTIHSSGTIVIRSLAPTFSYASELRYTYFGSESMQLPDWPLVAATIKSYGMGPVIQKALYLTGGPFPLDAVNPDYIGADKLREALDALHAEGIKYHISMAVMYADFIWLMNRGKGDMRQVDATGTPIDYWGCASNPNLRNHVKALVEELVQKYEIDGFSFDYVRYEGVDRCYCQYCKQKFEQYLGETITDWPGEFAPGQPRYKEFMEWRSTPISELVGLMRQWMDDARQLYHPELPPLEFTATTFMDTVNNLWWIGQDAIFWIKEGYIDVNLPMYYAGHYDSPYPTNVDKVLTWWNQSKNLVGGPEGLVPLAPLLTHTHGGIKPSDPDWKEEVLALINAGADGWSSWAYGGPGDNSGWPDIRSYWDLVPRSPVFSLSNITVSLTANSATITWTTDLPATSKVEYNTSPLFVASKIKAPSGDYPYAQLDYWDIDHVPGTIIEDTTPVTNHSVTIAGLTPGVVYYYRVQSQDSSGIATSKVYTFQL